jgi:hypothetical protein
MRICAHCALVKREYEFRLLKNVEEYIPEIMTTLICRACQRLKIIATKTKGVVVKIEPKTTIVNFN